MLKAGWVDGDDLHYEEVEGGTHTERAWADRFDRVLEYLYGPGGYVGCRSAGCQGAGVLVPECGASVRSCSGDRCQCRTRCRAPGARHLARTGTGTGTHGTLAPGTGTPVICPAINPLTGFSSSNNTAPAAIVAIAE